MSSRLFALLNEDATLKAASARMAPIAKNVQFVDAITFDALFLRNGPPFKVIKDKQPKRLMLLPVNLASLPDVSHTPLPVLGYAAPEGSGAADDNTTRGHATLYAPATRDRRAVWLHVHEDRNVPLAALGSDGFAAAAPGVKKASDKGLVRCLRPLEKPILLAEGVAQLAGMFEGAMPQPLDLVKVYNFRASSATGMFGISAVDAGMHPVANALPTDVRLAWALPYEQQLLPTALHLDRLHTAQERWAHPMPTVLLTVNRDGLGFDAPAVLPERGVPERPATGATVAIHEAPDRFYTPADAAKNKPDEIFFSYKLRVRQIRVVGAGVTLEQFMLKNVTMRSEQLTGLGIRYPRWIQALLGAHPVPFQLLVSVDVDETSREAANNDEDPAQRNGFEQGLITPRRLDHVEWLIRDYCVHRGIPVTRDTLLARYGEFCVPYKPVDFDQVVAERSVTATFKRPKIENPLAVPGHSSGVLALDEYTGTIPDADEYLFYALPLIALREPLPLDKADKDDAPKRVVLTAEKGHALVMAHRAAVADNAKPAQQREAWLQAAATAADRERRTPMFVFYGVKKSVLAAVDAYDQERAAAVARAAAAVPAPLDSALPATVEDLRDQLLLVGDAPTGKRPLEPAAVEEEPAAKRPRLEEQEPEPEEEEEEASRGTASGEELFGD